MKDLATRYSEACTRSGIAALIAAAACFTFAQRLAVSQPMEALGSYVLGRENLNVALGEIRESDFWPLLLEFVKKNDSNAESITLGQLASVECIDSDTKKRYVRERMEQPKPHTNSSISYISPIGHAEAQDGNSVAPMPPSIVDVKPVPAQPMPPSITVGESSIIYDCPGVVEAIAALTLLSDDETLDRARAVGNTYAFEIYRWQVARFRVFSRSIYSLAFGQEGFNASSKSRFHALTLEDLAELDRTPYTSVKEFDALVTSRLAVVTPYSLVQQGTNSASLVFQIVTLILAVYFFINLRAAIDSDVLFEKGTLFATMRSTVLGQVFAVSLIILPVAAAAYLANRMASTEKLFGMTAAFATLIVTGAILFLIVRAEMRLRKRE